MPARCTICLGPPRDGQRLRALWCDAHAVHAGGDKVALRYAGGAFRIVRRLDLYIACGRGHGSQADGGFCGLFGGSIRPAASVAPRLEVIPLGVNPNRFRPATAPERSAARARFNVNDDEVVVLCVGRLSHHAKAQPFPLFHAAEQAAQRSGRNVRLLFAGWAAHPAIDKAFRDGAKQFAPSVTATFVDGLDPAIRSSVWHAADVFASLPDNVQETFGLVVVEAMASGLPVVGSDWDGYRDLIADGETGYLIPTRMVVGATAEATMRLLLGRINYDYFLAECSQAVTVNLPAAADALTHLVANSGLRQRLGAAGRSRAERLFTWERVIRQYETLWSEQHQEVSAWRRQPAPRPGPAHYAAPEYSYASYPTVWLGDEDRLQATPGSSDRVKSLLETPLTNLAPKMRCSEEAILRDLLASAYEKRSVMELTTELQQRGINKTVARATIGWLLKYGLLRRIVGTCVTQEIQHPQTGTRTCCTERC